MSLLLISALGREQHKNAAYNTKVLHFKPITNAKY